MKENQCNLGLLPTVGKKLLFTQVCYILKFFFYFFRASRSSQKLPAQAFLYRQTGEPRYLKLSGLKLTFEQCNGDHYVHSVDTCIIRIQNFRLEILAILNSSFCLMAYCQLSFWRLTRGEKSHLCQFNYFRLTERVAD